MVPSLAGTDAATRQAALEALAALGTEQQAPAVIACLKNAPDDATRAQARKTLEALVARSGPKALDALLTGLIDTRPEVRLVLLEELGKLGGPRALEAVRAAMRSEDQPLREGAARVLAAWPNWEAASDLLGIVRTSTEAAWRSLAFRGYLRLCRETPMAAADRLARATEAAQLAVSTDEKLLVLATLADLPEPGTLKWLAAWLDDRALTEAVGVAAVKVSSGLGAKHKDAVVPLLQRVVKACQNAEVQKQARGVLAKLGAPSD
jgi:hypothetical protein